MLFLSFLSVREKNIRKTVLIILGLEFRLSEKSHQTKKNLLKVLKALLTVERERETKKDVPTKGGSDYQMAPK